MRKLLFAAVLLTLCAIFAAAVLAADVSVTGHLRDSFCFLTMGAHGPSHHDCAVTCAKAGIPVLLVQDGTNKYFVLMPPQDKQSLPSSITDKMEEEVTISGHEYSKGGMAFLTVESVK
jgi:hypothetical protein